MTTEGSAEGWALEVKRLTGLLQAAGRTDLMLKAIGVPLLEELRIEAARASIVRSCVDSTGGRLLALTVRRWRRVWTIW